ncbi:hypothetical protein IMX26_11210 [Clostridium sp. 'deep sea']|uniref:ABC transporter substrate-binding protein n=1 Tax=Clostridium sp. 'deep sea' TaxID=2779445 RepID=UPI001896663E|nr:ABC transporter substrate-binding protein [Clostridium sp. 'deep sea']QOR34059.1 hypothetical protein IMX26_11210 [Clostridium sp. 'deep sea']
MKRNLGVVLMVFVMMFSLLVGCDNATDPVGKDQQKIITIAQWNPPTGEFHPSYGEAVYDSKVYGLIFDSLVDMNEKKEFIPVLASSWQFSEDNLSCTFKLREGIKWHDGEEFNAEDIKYTFMSIGHPDYTGPRYSNVSNILGMEAYHEGESDNVEGIEIIDPYTVKITTESLYAPFLSNIGGTTIVAEHIFGDIPIADMKSHTDLFQNPVGTSAFKLESFEPDQYASLVKNEEYWQGCPKIDGIVIKAVNQDLAIAHLLKGDIDIIEINDFNPDDMATYAENNINIVEGLDLGFQYIGFNHTKETFQNKKLRQAFAHAIDRQGVVDSLLYGKGIVANNPYSPASWACPPLDTLKNYEYNPEKAISLMQEAGYTYEDGIMKKPNGKQLEIDFVYPSGNQIREQYCAIAEQNLAAIGVKMNMEIMEFATLRQRCKDGKFDMFAIGFTLGMDGDHMGIWAEGAPFNFPRYSPKKCIDLLDKGLSYADVEKRQEAYFEWAQFMNEEQPIIWMYNPIKGRAVAPRVKNIKYFNDSIYYDVHLWDIE